MASSLKLGSASIFSRKKQFGPKLKYHTKDGADRPIKYKITIPNAALPQINVRPKVHTMLTPPNSNGQRKLVIKIQKPSNASPTPPPSLPGYRIVTRTTVIENERKRKNPFRNPTPSPSPPHSEQTFRPLASPTNKRSFGRNPTPSPSSGDEYEEETFTEPRLKHPLAPDQLPVVSYDLPSSVGDDSSCLQSNSSSESKNIAAKRQFPWSKPSKADDEFRRPRFPEIDFDANLNDYLKRTEEEPNVVEMVAMNITLEELELFAKQFKQKRIKLGFTQGDVGAAMGKMYGLEFSQTTVSRFEALNLSFKNMCRLKMWLEKWLNDTERAVQKGMFEKNLFQPIKDYDLKDDGTIRQRRKRRTNIEGDVRKVLEQVYEHNKHPSVDVIFNLARDLNVTQDVVRVWFCNRRQRQRRSKYYENSDEIPSSTANIIPSSFTTIASLYDYVVHPIDRNQSQASDATGFMLFEQNSKTSRTDTSIQIDSSLLSSADDTKPSTLIQQIISAQMADDRSLPANHLDNADQQLDFNEDEYESDNSRVDNGER